MELFVSVTGAAWSVQNTWQVVVLFGYAAVFAGIGIRWCRWEAEA